MMFNRVLKITGFALVLSLLFSGVTWSAKDSLWEETEGGIIVNMGVIPSNNPSIVCAKLHSEEEGVEDIRKETSHHLLFIFRDATTGKLMKPEKVHVKLYAPKGNMVANKTLAPEIHAGIVNFCNFFDLKQKGAYKVELSYMTDGNSYRVDYFIT